MKRVSIKDNLRNRMVKTRADYDVPDSPTQSWCGSDDTAIFNEAVIESEEELGENFPELIRPRPKASTIGAFYEQVAACIAPLYGSSIFPRPPNSEKLHWEVATEVKEAELEHYDGQIVPQYLDDIKFHMKPILKAMDYAPKDTWALDRYSSDVSDHLR